MTTEEPVNPAAIDLTPAHMRQAPSVGPLPSLAAPTPIRFQLSNGIDVVAVRRQAAPIVALNLVLRTGADHDPKDRVGLASLTAEMLDEGRARARRSKSPKRWSASVPICGSALAVMARRSPCKCPPKRSARRWTLPPTSSFGRAWRHRIGNASRTTA